MVAGNPKVRSPLGRYVTILSHMVSELVVCNDPIFLDSWDAFVDLHVYISLIIHSLSWVILLYDFINKFSNVHSHIFVPYHGIVVVEVFDIKHSE